MSGYILVIAEDAVLPRLLPLFRSSETITRPLGLGRSLVCVSDAASSRATSIFQGYAIDHERERMIFAGAADADLPDPTAPLEGRYVTARVTDTEVTCGTDSYGFVPMVWFSDPRITAISDSYFSLITIRRALALPRTPHVETIRGRMWLNSMGAQQMGRETYCREIRYATPGTTLHVDTIRGTTTERPCDLRAFYTRVFDTHAEAVRESAERMVRTIKTYAASGGLTTLGLSGGTDSRLCLAAALAADIGESLQISCTNNATRSNKIRDYAVAVELSERFGFPLNSSRTDINGTLQRNDLLRGWASASMGIYDALYMPQHFRERDVAVFAIGGQGAEISKGNYGWRTLAAINMPPEALAQSQRALAAIGVDPDDPWGSEWHYLAFRNAIHGGRGILSSDYLARPAAQIPLIGLSRSPLNDLPAPRKASPSIILDTLITLNPDLAMQPYDDPRKQPTAAYVSERLQRLGGHVPVIALEPYTCVGMPRSSNGTLGTHTDLADAAGFTGDLDPKTLLPLADQPRRQARELIPEDVHQRIEALDPSSTARIGAASREGVALGKLIALGTLL